MNNHQLKIRKILTSFGMFSFILAASNIDVYSRNLQKNKSFIIKKSTEAELPSSNFYQENFVNYLLYKKGCGREKKLDSIWGK